jgi:hypothetical protein
MDGGYWPTQSSMDLVQILVIAARTIGPPG